MRTLSESTFYYKFGNMPNGKRYIPVQIGAREITPYQVYIELNRLTDIRRENERAIKELLVIAESIMR